MDEQLKPCPFCGGKATIREYANGHKGNGAFTASYKCGCEKCKIFFERNSEFVLERGKPKFIQNGYDIAVEKWNERLPPITEQDDADESEVAEDED